MLLTRSSVAAVATALSLTLVTPAAAQVSGGSSGSTPQDRDVRASTSGYGSTDGQSINVGGTADAAADEGGTATTSTRATTNDRRGMQRSKAAAQDEDERARSRTHTTVRQGEVVRSRTHSFYKQKGERPVIDRSSTTSKPPKK